MPLKGWRKNKETGEMENMNPVSEPLGAITEEIVAMAEMGVVPKVAVNSMPDTSKFQEAGINQGFVGNNPEAANTRPGMIILYKEGKGDFYAAQNLTSLGRAGYRIKCQVCGSHHVDENGRLDKSPNACPGTENVAWTVCQYPSCTKVLYARRDVKDEAPATVDAEGYVALPMAEISDADLLAQSNAIHAWVRHPTWAARQRVPKPDELTRPVQMEPVVV